MESGETYKKNRLCEPVLFYMSLLAMIFFNKGLAFLRKVMYYRKVS